MFNKEQLKEVFLTHTEEFAEQIKKYEEIEDNPELILTSLFEDNTRGLQLTNNILRRHGISNEDVQKRCFELLKEYFKSLDDEVELRIDIGGTFLLSYKDFPFIKFNIHHRNFYDARRNIEHLQHDIENLEEDLAINNKKFLDCTYYRENLLRLLEKEAFEDGISLVSLFVHRVTTLFQIVSKREEIKNNLSERIKNSIEREKCLQDEIVDKKMEKVELEDASISINDKSIEWAVRFGEWGYKDFNQVLKDWFKK